MSTTTTTRRGVRWKQVLAMAGTTLVLSLLMSSCGGGGGVGSGGTGSPATNLGDGSFSGGTVTGFGSLVVDGIAYDDTQVPVMVEAQPNVLTPATAKLGHYTELEFGGAAGQEAVRTIRIEAAAVGRIDAVDAAGHSLTTLGQTIVENTSADAGPITFYSGVAGLSALRAGDAVEIHGVPRWSARSGRYEVLAARIEKLQSNLPTQRLAGVVQNESAGGRGRTFRLGEMQIDYSPLSTLPAGSVLRDGDRVVVWFDRPTSAGSLEAGAVRVVARSLPAAGKDARLSGTLSRLDNASQRFDLAGVEVRYTSANVTPSGKGFALEDGAYVVVDGAYAIDGSLEAKHVKIRKRGALDYVEVDLTGSIEAFLDVSSFLVRGTPVDALGALALRGCGNASLRNGLNVRIEGNVQAGAAGSLVKAETVRCVN
jgi:hypothetical protein